MTDPHPVPDEDPEQHIGEPVPDPWAKPDDRKCPCGAPMRHDGALDSDRHSLWLRGEI